MELRTATTSLGIGGFTEVTPGEVQVKAGGTADRCIPRLSDGWPGDDMNTITLPVREGYVTHGILDCPVQP